MPWQVTDERHVGGHAVYLVTRTVDELPQWEVVVDCITQYRGGETDARGKFRAWVRQLSRNAKRRAAK